MTCSAAALTSDLSVAASTDIGESLLNHRWNATSGGIEKKWVDHTEFYVLAVLKRFMRIGQRYQHLAAIFEVHMILVAKVLDPMHAADDAASVGRGDPQVLGADADGVGAGGHRYFGNEAGGKEIDLRRA